MCGFHDARHCEQIFIPSCLHPKQRDGKIISVKDENEITEVIVVHHAHKFLRDSSDVD
jgi:hypothetical protein